MRVAIDGHVVGRRGTGNASPAMRPRSPEAAGSAVVLADPMRDEAVVEGLLRAATDEALRAQLATAGPQHVARFTWDRCAEQTVVAYRAAIEGAGQG